MDPSTRSLERPLQGPLLREGLTPAADMLVAQSDAARPSLSFFVMLGLSTVIATNGLISDSAATVIGAMIVAPLMQPIGAMAYGLATTRRGLLLQAMLTTLAGAAFTVSIAYLATLVVGVQTVGREIVARTAPSELDLVVALAAGTAGAFCVTRRNLSDAFAGVAIAVALVPPLCVVGIGLALGDTALPEVGIALQHDIATGALLLFFANFAGIVFSELLVFVVSGYGRWDHALGGILMSSTVIVGLAFPLMFAMQDLLARSAVRRHFAELRRQRPEFYQQIVMQRLAVDQSGDALRVDVDAICPQNLEFDPQAETERIRSYLAQKTGKTVSVKATIIRADVSEANSLH